MFFDSWAGLVRVLVAGTLAYTALVLLLRVSGKRTLSKLNAFDFVITVALGSTLATVVISKDVALLEGMLAFAVLIFAQYAVTALSVRFASVRDFVKARPRLLAYRGELIREALREERFTVDEVSAVLREEGYAAVGDTGAVVLETDGTVSVLPPHAADGRALDAVGGRPRGDPGARSGQS